MPEARPLSGRVALVTGASRGIGRGIAVGLGEAGATVVVTARSVQPPSEGLPGTLGETAALAEAAGARVLALRCDHSRDEDAAAVFARIAEEFGRLDILVNNATAATDPRLLFSKTPFWVLGPQVWDGMFSVGVRSHYTASQQAARLMINQRSGLIVNISSAGAARKAAVVPYGVAKAAVDRMTADMAIDLKDYGVAVVSLWPPPTATEGMYAARDANDDPTDWSLPVVTGRVIAALYTRGDLMQRSGTAMRVRDLAEEFSIADERAPRSPMARP